MRCLIGIDLGGTNIAAGAVTQDGRLLSKCSLPTGADRPAEEIVRDMARAALLSLEQAGLERDAACALGVGVPGAVDARSGMVLRTTNLDWRSLPLGEQLKKLTGLPVYLGNDADCAALGEVHAGAARDYDSAVMITLGTGVGGGIIIDGKIYAGMRSMGAELGHTLLVLEGEHCTCGRDGCWEAYASATALIRQGKRAGEQHPESALHGREELTALDVFQAADAGDTAAQAVIDRWCVYVAAGMTDLVNSLAPEMILLGGGISRQGERILAPIRAYVTEHCFGGREGAIPVIAAAQLGNEAGIIGAAAL